MRVRQHVERAIGQRMAQPLESRAKSVASRAAMSPAGISESGGPQAQDRRKHRRGETQ